jgi:aspartyl-tRNA(Asn)/glutamyl-tRNA(Gln) amidotransferase subunit A
MSALWQLSAAQLTQGYRNGDFTPGEVMEACLARVAEWQPHINALLMTDKGGAKLAASASRLRWARQTPLGPLDGVPVSINDNLHAGGLPTSWGSKLLQGFVARRDELPVARLRAAGAVVFGKTSLNEFTTQFNTANDLVGVTRNPWNLALTPGGPAGGAAAAVATGFGPLALATDAGGGIRRPASLCGVIAFKSSHGRVPREGGLPVIHLDYEQIGGVARSVRDVADLVRALASPAPGLGEAGAKPSRILFVTRVGAHPVEPAVATQVAAAAARLQALGHAVEQADQFDLVEPVNERWPRMSCSGIAWMLDHAASLPEFRLQPGQNPDLSQCSEAVRTNLDIGRKLGATALYDLLAAVQALKIALAEVFTRYDFILTPACAALPWPAEQPFPAQIDGQAVSPREHTVFTTFASAAGLPALVLPCGPIDGLPCGFQLVGPPGADAEVLALGLQYEQAHPRSDLWPQLPA